MLDLLNTTIKTVSVHRVGNSFNGEEIQLSSVPLNVNTDLETQLLLRYFLKPFASPEFYCFTSTNDDLSFNPVYNFAKEVFETETTFHTQSKNIANYLFEIGTHPQIKGGDLFVTHFTTISIDNQIVEAIGIFKSENRQSFLKLDAKNQEYALSTVDGINVEKLDKGCLILNINEESGYKVCVIDNTNKSNDAQYWKDEFLKLKALSDDYHHTKDFLNLAKTFISKQLPNEFEVTKTAQIDLLNRSIQFFKDEEEFNNERFTHSVIQDPQVIESFNEYKKVFEEKNNVEFVDEFEISTHAVKKQARVFKSVLKLDKNFHIYIHGDKSLIEQGKDTNGRKFYKIYYDEEL